MNIVFESVGCKKNLSQYPDMPGPKSVQRTNGDDTTFSEASLTKYGGVGIEGGAASTVKAAVLQHSTST
jgi:hypothetical protein